MSGADEIDALVVGAGPVGLTLAAELTRHHVRCRIVDRTAARSDKSKALVVWPRTLELLASSGAVEPFLTTGMRAASARLFGDGVALARLTFEGVASPYPFALMIPQSETERLLEEHLNRLGIEVERTTELLAFTPDETGVAVQLRGNNGQEESVHAAWLLGCDGAHSTVRHGLGMDFAGAAEPSDWMLADVYLSGPIAPDEIRIDWCSAGILAFFPIGAQRFRVVADGGPAAATERPADPTLAEVQAVLDARGPGGLTAHDPVWLTGFRINERKVREYRRGRAFLAGDAAHIHSPVGGQGMNTGMHDAYNLAWKLGLVQAGRGRELLLDSYSRERSAVGDVVLRNAAAMTRVATLHSRGAQRARNLLLPALASLGLVRSALRDTLSEMNINYRGGPLSRDDRSLPVRAGVLLHAGVVAGDRAPDAPLIDAASNTATRLFSVLRSGRHCLLLCIGDAEPGVLSQTLADIAAAVARRYANLVDVFVVAPAGAPSGLPLLIDQTRSFHTGYGIDAPSAVLLRPDGYIGYFGQPLDRERILAHLDRYLMSIGRLP
jgi:2-polyprenyl-6-methoxyphenol hydroxylase-like FAD-dependent oxidoreductase